MACDVKSVKLSVIGLSCLQKLIAHDAVAPSAVKYILSTLKEHAEMTDESVQLKTLQTILIVFQSHLHPLEEEAVERRWSLMRLLGVFFRFGGVCLCVWEDMAQALGICLRLLESSRSSDSVRNTAAATFRQAVALIFDSVACIESLPTGKIGSGSHTSRASTITDDISRSFNNSVSLDSDFVSGGPTKREGLSKVGKLGLRLLEDLTALAAGGSATWLRVISLQRAFALDILEFILSNYTAMFQKLIPYEKVLRHQICSLLMTSLRTNAEVVYFSFMSAVMDIDLTYLHILLICFLIQNQLEGEAGEPTFRRLVLRAVANVIRMSSLSLVTESEVYILLLSLMCPCLVICKYLLLL
ncbi:hypothetical protein MUK42_15016 [Musa troglodytarum]|uniref:Mon2/Sec7/BIG1-like dimerisation and cyclophilin-binding domain-containing protein n=1 Tax=Musa troglodytarum TaxID=320322 RepID=A0A9E7KEP2_9LILI|nr:hypothetical protein MUK42_15016 [Musa troglodytarum]